MDTYWAESNGRCSEVPKVYFNPRLPREPLLAAKATTCSGVASFEQGKIGSDRFRHACLMGPGVGLQAPRPALLFPPVAVLGQMRNRQHRVLDAAR
jgi:hypothetical protein